MARDRHGDMNLDVLHRCLASAESIEDASGPSGPHPYLWVDPAGRSASLWMIIMEVRLGLLSLTCLIRQDSDGGYLSHPEKSSTKAV